MAQWQVIFRIRNTDGIVRDYCREQPPMTPTDEFPFLREATREEVQAWAEAARVQHGLHSFEIQYW